MLPLAAWKRETELRMYTLPCGRGWRYTAPPGLKVNGEARQERLNESMSLYAPREHSLNNTGIPDLAQIGGLSQEEAQRRLKQEGYNELPSTRRRSCLPSR